MWPPWASVPWEMISGFKLTVTSREHETLQRSLFSTTCGSSRVARVGGDLSTRANRPKVISPEVMSPCNQSYFARFYHGQNIRFIKSLRTKYITHLTCLFRFIKAEKHDMCHIHLTCFVSLLLKERDMIHIFPARFVSTWHHR